MLVFSLSFFFFFFFWGGGGAGGGGGEVMLTRSLSYFNQPGTITNELIYVIY